MRVQRLLTETENKKIADNVDLKLIEPLIEKYKGKKGNLIPLLQGVQSIYGYIPRSAFELLSAKTGLKLSDMYGVATFYAQFRLSPVGKHIVKVCHGTACHVQGADAISTAIKDALGVSDGETTPDKLFTLETVACLGCCSLAPVMMIDEESYGKLTGSSAVKIIKEIKIKEKENK
ncbi:MAG: NADH-quinone oxidoreductase subunit NuoE [Bacteroidales bacterium]|nr:NADH-quinone oxidoreductase subunit NuoE [Bacteroidales bacterium]HRX31334.1 NADH-quinone oxidoreductase subunit NuoE [Tenuifilaceae bacterium]